MNEQQFLTDIEVAQRWQMKPGTLRQWRIAGKGPAWKSFGRSVRYAWHEILEWENQQSRSSTTEGGSAYV